MNTKFYKYCSVPMCKSTTIKTPEKLFIHVPKNKQIRRQWFALAKRDLLSMVTNCYFCEDHFDLPNDMENYMEYTTMGVVSQIRMKAGCLPTKFACISNSTMDLNLPITGKKQRLASTKRLNRIKTAACQKCEHQVSSALPSRSSDLITLETVKMEESSHPEPHSPAGEGEERLQVKVSLPCSPLYIKQEREFEDSPTDPSPAVYIKQERCEDTDPKVDYEALLSQLQQEMAELKMENQRLVEENRTLTEKEGNSMNDGQKLNILTETEESFISKLKSDNQSLAEEKLRLTDEIESIKRKSERNIQKLTEKNKDCLAKIQKLESTIQELDKRIEDLIDVDKLAEKNQDLYEKVQYLNQKVEHLNKETTELNHKKAELGKKVKSFEDIVRDLAAHNQALQTELSQLEKNRESKRRRKVV